VPRVDVFSFSMPGAPFTPPEWLAEIGIAWLYDRFGWGALVAATALSVAAALTMLLRALLRNLMPAHALIATVLATLLVLPHLLARPHVLTLPVLVWWAAELLAARSADRAPPLWLVPLLTLWANLHSSYIFGLGLAALLAGEALVAAGDRRARLGVLQGWGRFILFSVGAALITPFGLDGLLLPIDLATMNTLSLITEWKSPNFQQFQPLEVWIMAFLLAALSGGWRLPPTRVLMLLLLLYMALRHGRYAELLGLVGPLLLAPALGPQLAKRSGHQVLFLDRGMTALVRPASPLGFALAGAMALGLSALALRGGIARGGDAITPAAALAVVAEHHRAPYRRPGLQRLCLWRVFDLRRHQAVHRWPLLLRRRLHQTLCRGGVGCQRRAAAPARGIPHLLDPARRQDPGRRAARSSAGLATTLRRRHRCGARPRAGAASPIRRPVHRWSQLSVVSSIGDCCIYSESAATLSSRLKSAPARGKGRDLPEDAP
jgi:hypothetical protein